MPHSSGLEIADVEALSEVDLALPELATKSENAFRVLAAHGWWCFSAAFSRGPKNNGKVAVRDLETGQLTVLHVALLAGFLVALAICWHSAACFKNSSAGMGRSRKPTNARLRRLRAHRRFIGRNRPHGSNMIPRRCRKDRDIPVLD